MLVKVLDENRVKILVEDQDIAYYDLPFEKLSDDDPASRNFIYDLIRKTYEHTGIDFKDCKVMIEVVPGISGSYYVLLTRISEDGEEKLHFDKAEIAERETYIFKLPQAGAVFAFFGSLKVSPPQESRLYLLGDAYYAVLLFDPTTTQKASFKKLMVSLSEFASRCRYRYMNEGILKEWGECLCDEKACEAFIYG